MTILATKTCCVCGESKSVNAFHLDKRWGSYSRQCQVCINNAKRAKRLLDNPDRKARRPNGHKRCQKCGEVKATSGFKLYSNGYRGSYCDECRASVSRSGGPVLPEGQKQCKNCLEIKALDCFYLNKGRPASACKYCANRKRHDAWRKKRDLQELPPDRLTQSVRQKRSFATSTAKLCPKCDMVKPLEEFHPKGARWHSHCKICRCAAKRADVLGAKTARNLRTARKRGAGGTYTKRDIRIKLRDQKGRCWWCHEKLGKLYHIDHVYPIAKGGSSDPSNIAISCPTCNNRKHAKTPWEFAGRLF